MLLGRPDIRSRNSRRTNIELLHVGPHLRTFSPKRHACAIDCANDDSAGYTCQRHGYRQHDCNTLQALQDQQSLETVSHMMVSNMMLMQLQMGLDDVEDSKRPSTIVHGE